MYRRIWGPTTTAIHAGRAHNETRGLVSPVFQSSAFRLLEPEEGAAFAAAVEPSTFYTRLGNPNFGEVEAALAALEHAERCLLTSSGMAALATVFEAFLAPGARVVAPRTLYTGTEQLLRRWEAHRGLRVAWIEDTLDLGAWEAALAPETALILVETPSNPTLAVTDLAAVAELARTKGVRSVADNTLATPIFTRPLDLGVDLVVNSATKYLGGHADLVLGALCGREADVAACWQVAALTGPTPDPMAAWLLQRGLKTLYLRVRRAADNAESLANWLTWQSQVARVAYPGLKEHPGHAVAARQMQGGFGALLSFELRGGLEAGRRFCQALEIVTPAVSLGGVESLIQHPASTSHLQTSAEAKARLGITDGLLRLSVGIEDEADLKADLERGFQAATLLRGE